MVFFVFDFVKFILKDFVDLIVLDVIYRSFDLGCEWNSNLFKSCDFVSGLGVWG